MLRNELKKITIPDICLILLASFIGIKRIYIRPHSINREVIFLDDRLMTDDRSIDNDR